MLVKAIIFDLDDTLLWDEKSIKTAFEKTAQVAAEKYKLDPADFEKAVRQVARDLYASYDTYEFTKMIGINPFEGLWGSFLDEGEDFQKLSQVVPTYRKEAWTKGLAQFGVNDPNFGEVLSERFREERRKHPFVYEDTYAVLNELKGKYKLLLLTNGSPSLQKEKLTITPKLVPYFDEIIISGAFGKGKPAVEIFEYALNQLKIEKEEAIMVGDNSMTDILGASRLGMRSAWLNRHGKDRNHVTPTYEIKSLHELIGIVQA